MRHAIILVLLLLMAVSAAAQSQVRIDPPDSIFSPSEPLELSFRVGASADTISGFQLYLSFDPAVVELVEATEGTLYMASGYATWPRFEELEPGFWHFFDTVLGDDTYVLPPGELLHLEFTAVDSGVTIASPDTVRLADLRRNDLPVAAAYGAQITVVPTSGVDEQTASGLKLGPPHPNPSRGDVRASFTRPPGRGAVLAEVYDASGRLIRRLELPRDLVEGQILWDGRTSDGSEAPSSVYFLRVADDAGTATRAVVKVR